MALEIPSYPNPFDAANPLTDSYGWLAYLALDSLNETGRLQLNINPNAAAWESKPIATLTVSLGQPLVAANPAANPPVAAVSFPTLAQLMTDAEFAAAYQAIGTKLYEALLHYHPALAGATEVP